MNTNIIRGIGRLTELRKLCLHGESVKDMDSEWLTIILESFRDLEALSLGSVPKLTEADIGRIRQLVKLKSLNLGYSPQLTERSLERGIGSPNMELLTLRFGGSLTDAGLALIAANHHRLKRFVLVRCEKVTPAGLLTLLESETSLQKLFLGEVPVEDDFLDALAELCPRLRWLGIFPSRLIISDSALERFTKRRPTVNVQSEVF